MKFLDLHLEAYGHFADKKLEFDPSVPFQLIYGDNEAGKSTSLRAVQGFLYGIPGQTKDMHRYSGPQMRLGAKLQNAQSQEVSLVRRKGNKDTLLDATGAKIEEAVLTALLGGTSLEIFKSQFCFSHDDLRSGSEELANAKGALGPSLFQAGGNLRNLSDLKAALQTEEDRLFKPHGRSKSIIGTHFGALTDVRRSITDESLSPTERKAQETEYESQKKELLNLRQSREVLTKKLSRLNRVQAALPVMSELRSRRAAIAELGDVVKLPVNAAQQREKWEQVLEAAGKDEAKIQASIGKAQETLDNISIPEKLRTQGDAVMELYQKLNGFREAKQKLPDAQAELKQQERAAHDLRAELEEYGEIGSVEALRTMLKKLPALRELAKESAVLAEKLENVEKDRTKRASKLEEQQHKLAQLSAGMDTAGLKRALKKAAQAPGIEAQIAALHSELTLLSTQIETDVKALGLWQGTLGELIALPLPLEVTVKRFEQSLRENADKLKQQTEGLEELEQKAKELQNEIDKLVSEGRLWTEEELENLRLERDRTWQQIRGVWLGGQSPAAEGDVLANNYETQVSQADQAADTLRKEAQRTANLQMLRTQIDVNAQAQQEKIGEKNGLGEQAVTLHADWLKQWQACGIEPLPPGEMLDWLAKQKEICAKAENISKLRLGMQEQQDKIKEWRDELSGVLVTLGQGVLPENEKLTDSLARLEEWQTEQDTLTTNRKKLEGDIADKAEELKEKGRELEALESQDLKTWQDAWQQLAGELGALGTGEPEAVVGTLEQVNDYIELAKQCTACAELVEKYNGSVEAFTKDVVAQVNICAPDLAGLPPENAVIELEARLKKANLDFVRLIEAQKSLDELTSELPGIAEQMEAARKALAVLVANAACPDIEGLRVAEERSATLRELEEAVQGSLKTLATHAAGMAPEEFVAELEKENADEVAALLSRLTENLKNVDEKYEQLLSKSAVLGDELAKEAGDTALDAAQQSQDIVRQLQDSVERYVRVKLSRLILDQEIERYRQTNQNPVLARTSQLFQQLTRGSFTGVDVSEQSDGQYLVGVRADKNELRTDAMSDGTRDQLFLALRMASLENHLQHATALPLIVDDILVNFDDSRAAAAFEVLGQVSQKTQVLFFTHHSRLADLGREVLGSGMQVNEL